MKRASIKTDYKIGFDRSLKIGGGISQAMLRKGSKLDTKKKRLDDRTTKCKTEYTRTGQMVRIAHTKDRTKDCYSVGLCNPLLQVSGL